MADQKYIKKNKINFGFIGTFGPWHGTEILAKAVKKVVQNNSNIHFVLIGEGKNKEISREIIRKDKVEKFVTFTGLLEHNQAIATLKACDILITPQIPNPDGTPFFGSPTKLFEYMALKK